MMEISTGRYKKPIILKDSETFKSLHEIPAKLSHKLKIGDILERLERLECGWKSYKEHAGNYRHFRLHMHPGVFNVGEDIIAIVFKNKLSGKYHLWISDLTLKTDVLKTDVKLNDTTERAVSINKILDAFVNYYKSKYDLIVEVVKQSRIDKFNSRIIGSILPSDSSPEIRDKILQNIKLKNQFGL